MIQIYKNIVIGMIIASFTFTPVAFAKPRSKRGIGSSSGAKKTPLYTNLFTAIKKNRKSLEVSHIVEGSAPMFKNRALKDIRKMTLPAWDKKIKKFTVGRNYVKIKIGGRSLFIRFVDRGPVAFIVNKKPFLWKDVLIYSRAKARMTEIITGQKRIKKVSYIDSLLNDIFPKANAQYKQVKPKQAQPTEPISVNHGYIRPKPKPIQRPRPPNYQTNNEINCKKIDGATFENNSCYCISNMKRSINPSNGSCHPPKKPNRVVVKPVPNRPQRCIAKNGTPAPHQANDSSYKNCMCSDGTYINPDKEKCGAGTNSNTDSFAKHKEQCAIEKGQPYVLNSVYKGCQCPNKSKDEEGEFFNTKNMPKCTNSGAAAFPVGKSWMTKALIGVGLIGLLVLLLKKKKRSGDDVEEPLPGPNYSHESECPNQRDDGSYGRDFTEETIPPHCRKSSCEKDNSCGSTTSGSIDGYGDYY